MAFKDTFLKEKPKFEEIAEEFLEYIEGATLVIHNAPFDLGFLNHELALMGAEQRIEDNCKIIDSLCLLLFPNFFNLGVILIPELF